MKYLFLLVFVFLFCQCKNQKAVQELPGDESEVVFAFGSCNKQDSPQILWDDILINKPDAWIWLGDNIYGDSPDSTVMKNKYDKQKNDPGYEALRAEMPVYGIWDDHDYGLNDGGNEFEPKALMRDLMLEFLEVPKSNDVWNRAGGYQSYDLNVKNISIKLILLDSRYFRDAPIKNGKNYSPNMEGSILGSAQWKWLEKEVAESKADLLIIGNGIQVIPEDHRFEKWANFPNERQRLLDLLKNKGDAHAILLSGDRHIVEVSKLDIDRQNLYEITCSGMTHTYTKFSGEVNRHRVGKVVTKKNFGILRLKSENGKLSAVFESRGDENVIHERYVLN